MVSKPTFLVDMDGTLCHYDSQLVRDQLSLMTDKEKLLVPKLTSAFDIEQLDPVYEERSRLIKRQPGWWRNLRVIRSSMDIVEMAHKMGFEIHILTKGPKTTTSAWTEKVDWVRDHMRHIDPLVHVVSDKRYFKGDVLFDDWPSYVSNWIIENPEGIVLFPKRSWNEFSVCHSLSNVYSLDFDRFYRFYDPPSVQLDKLYEFLSNKFKDRL